MKKIVLLAISFILSSLAMSAGEAYLWGSWEGDKSELFTAFSGDVPNGNIPAAPTLSLFDRGNGVVGLMVTAPSLTVEGKAISGKIGILIFCNGVRIYTRMGLSPGESDKDTDYNLYAGSNNFEVYAVNDKGERGEPVYGEVVMPIDVEVVSINLPVSGLNLTAQETVEVLIKNNSPARIINTMVTLEVNGAVVARETIRDEIAAGDEYTHTFTAKADLSAVQTHEVKVYTENDNDSNPDNNTKVKSVENYGNAVLMESVPSVTSCDIRFMDDGGSDDYTTGSDQIITFYPGMAGNMVCITFNDLATTEAPDGTSDTVYVLDGAFTMDEINNNLVSDEDIVGIFYGDYTGNLPASITADNPAGALTIYFKLRSALRLPNRGWDAHITCVAPPTTPVPPVPSLYSITIPEIEGAVTDPAAGTHHVNIGDPFTLSLTLDDEYNASEVRLYANGKLLEPQSLRATTYRFHLEEVNYPITFRIEGVTKNDPLGIVNPSGDDGYRVYTEASLLYIEALKASETTIYGIDGKLYAQRRIGEGLTQIPLPAGTYVVRIGNESWKVVVKGR